MENKIITMPKLNQIKIRGYRKTKEIKGKIINATISKEINRYYVSVLYEIEKESEISLWRKKRKPPKKEKYLTVRLDAVKFI